MKKLVVLLLTAAMVLTIVGCKKQGEVESDPTEFIRDEGTEINLQPDA